MIRRDTFWILLIVVWGLGNVVLAQTDDDDDQYGPYECVPYNSYKDELYYCDGFVNWPLVPDDAKDIAAAEIRANSSYAAMLAKFRKGEATAACLSYQAYYACVNEFRRCELGDATPICEFVCEEHERRCEGDPSNCETTEPTCSGSAANIASVSLLIIALIASILMY